MRRATFDRGSADGVEHRTSGGQGTWCSQYIPESRKLTCIQPAVTIFNRVRYDANTDSSVVRCMFLSTSGVP